MTETTIALSLPDIAILIAMFMLAGFVKGAIRLGLPTIAMGLLGAWFFTCHGGGDPHSARTPD